MFIPLKITMLAKLMSFVFLNLLICLLIPLITTVSKVSFIIFFWPFLGKIASSLLTASTILLSFGVFMMSNPIHSLVCLIGVFFLVVCVLLTYLQVEFLALIFLIIYIGAIAILFLFVIMMFNLKEITIKKRKPWKVWLLTEGLLVLSGVYGGLVIYYILTKYIHSLQIQLAVENTEASPNLLHFILYTYSDIMIFSNLLYTQYFYLFILSGLILLTAMVGAITLALSTENESKKE